MCGGGGGGETWRGRVGHDELVVFCLTEVVETYLCACDAVVS